MKLKKEEWKRVCKHCKKPYKSKSRRGEACDLCIKKNRKKLKPVHIKGGGHQVFINKFKALGIPEEQLIQKAVYERRKKKKHWSEE